MMTKELSDSLLKRRLIPLKSLNSQMGILASLIYCLQQQPTLLPLSPVGLGVFLQVAESLRLRIVTAAAHIHGEDV